MKRGLNSSDMQMKNRVLVFKTLLENGELSRTELAECLGLQKATITNIINEFLKMKIVRIGELKPSAGSGRKSERLMLSLDNMYILSMGITREDYQLAVFTLGGAVVEQKGYRFGNECDVSEAVDHLKQDAVQMMKKYGEETIFDICLAVPGLYMRNKNLKGDIFQVAQFDELSRIDIRSELEEAVGRPIEIVHDAKLAAYAEWKNAPEAKEDPNISLAIVRSRGFGIGAGFVVGGRILEGGLGIAGEIGRIGFNYVPEDEVLKKSYEYYAGAGSAVRYAKEELCRFPDSPLNGNMSYFEVYRQYLLGDSLAAYAVEKTVRMLAYGLINIVYTMNPDVIIFGPDYPAEERVLQVIKEILAEYVPELVLKHTKLRFSSLSADSFLLGGYYHIMDRLCQNSEFFERINEQKKG